MLYEFRNMFNSILLYLPNILKAIVLLLIAWGAAVLVRNLTKKVLEKTGVAEHLAKGRKPADPAYGKERAGNIAQIVYFLVFLLFIPSILDALDMESVSGPITHMMQNILGFIPRLIGAGIVLFIGYFIAKILRDLSYQFLKTVNIDKWYDKISPEKSYQRDVNQEEVGEKGEQLALADILSKIVFGLVMIPIITIALETLKIATLTEPILLVLNNVMGMVPNVFVAILLIVLGYYIAQFVASILEGLIIRMGVEKAYNWIDKNTQGKTPRFNLAKIIANIVKGLIIFFMTVEALRVLKLDVLNTIGYAAIAYLPLLLSGLLIIGLGVVAGYFVESLINKYAQSPFTAVIAKYIIIIFAVFMTLEQVRFASRIVTIAFLLVLGGLSVAFALSFGLGGRDFAGRQLERFEESVEKKNKEHAKTDNLSDKVLDKDFEDHNPNLPN